MLKQPKGLIAAALANTGERFGFYTMMAILTLFLMSKFGIDGEQAGKIYSFFYTSIYILALVGGLIADRLRNYKGTIIAGILVMTAGYAALMVPTVTSKTVVIGALMLIAFGNGLFKGNLQALVGQLYDNEQYAKLRDTGFQIFYMFINIGAMFAPFAAVGVRNWWLRTQGFLYNSDLSALCHQYIGGTMSPEVAQGRFSELAAEVSLGGVPADMGVFAQSYLNAFNTGFHYAFGVAIVALVFSLVVFLANKKKLPDPKVAAASRTTPSKAEIQQDAREIKQRLYALFAVFAIVIFFWFSFHQNGLTLTLFAQDYTRLEIFGMPITAEIFQSANPFCVVFLTPVIIAVFAWLRNRGKEPSTPMKIAIGMGIAAFAYVLMVFGSLGLPKLAAELGVDLTRVPVTIRIVLESILRNCDEETIHAESVKKLAGWKANAPREETPFVVSRVILQDLTGVPLLADLAAMRSEAARRGLDPNVWSRSFPWIWSWTTR